jgi:NADH-quinone oxidoreductase subunit G
MLGYAQKGGVADLVAAKPKMVFSLGADEVDWTKFADSMIVTSAITVTRRPMAPT